MRACAARRPCERRSETRVCAADDLFYQSAGTAALLSGARPFPAAGTATQPQERLRDTLTILHVLRAQKRGPRPVLPVSSTGRDDAGRRLQGPATEVDRQDGQALSAAQVLPLGDELSRVREDQAAVLLPGNERERHGCEGRPRRIRGREWNDDVGLGRGGAVRRSEFFIIPIASCLQGTILAPTPARPPTDGSVAHGH
jgi:hypothetical protein